MTAEISGMEEARSSRLLVEQQHTLETAHRMTTLSVGVLATSAVAKAVEVMSSDEVVSQGAHSVALGTFLMGCIFLGDSLVDRTRVALQRRHQ